jgi:mannosyltransferase
MAAVEPQETSARSGSRAASRRGWLALAAILLLAAILRLPALGRAGMWNDECLTANWVELPWRQTVAAAASDNNAPLYFLLDKFPVELFGTSETAWRLFPALLGLLTVWAIYVAGRRLLSPTAGAIAALLLAISPAHVHYSREARNYALLVLLVVVAFVTAGRVRRRGNATDVALLAALLATAMYTHAVAAFAALGILVAWSVFPFDRRAVGRLALAAALAGAVMAPWLPRLLHQSGRAGVSYAWNAPNFEREFPWQIPRSLAALSHGSLAPIRNRVADLLPSAWAAAGLTALLAALAVAHRRRFADAAAPWRLLVAALVPLLALFAAAIVGPPVYVVGRADVVALPFLVLVAAAGVAALPSRTVRALALAAFAGLAILPFEVLYRIDTRSEERLIAGVVTAARRPGEPVVATTLLPCLQFYARLHPGEDLFAFPARPAPTADWIDWPAHPAMRWPAEATALAGRVRDAARRDSAARMWTITGDGGPDRALSAVLDRSFSMLGALDLHYRGLALRAYAIPPPGSR